MLAQKINSDVYWIDEFVVTDEDLDYLFNIFLETETPLGLRDLTLKLIEYRIDQAERTMQRQIEAGELFQPQMDYEVGQRVVFPQFDYAVGEVVAKRSGNNPEHGDFSVIEVAFEENDTTREFASSLSTAHNLNIEEGDFSFETVEAKHILRHYGRKIAYKLKDKFDEQEDVVYLAGRWFLQSLLADVDIGHLHLAEAVLDMHGGGPLGTEAIWQEIGMPEQVNHRLQIFSMDYALQQDNRFDEVGPAGEVLWYLHRMEPEAVKTIPTQIRYEHTPYNRTALTEDLLEMELDIDDELSPIDLPEEEEDEVTITITYPYRRTGTLPLTPRLQHLFPTAYETTRIMTTLVDAQSDEEVQGWVVREHGYVYGLEEFYRQYQIPIGAYVTIRRHEESNRLLIDFFNRKPRTEWIPLAIPEDNRLRFESLKRSIGAEYDDLMIFGIEDLAAIDKLWERLQSYSLGKLLNMLVTELTRLSPQATVHVKTLYSALNIIRRCPPGPIFAELVTNPDFEHVAGPYWRVA